jgi:hypothetical protein
MARKPSRQVGTLGDLAFHGHTLTLSCEGCRHWSTLDLGKLIAANGPDYLVRKVVARAVCSRCSDRDADVSCTLSIANRPSAGKEPY